MNTEPGTQTDQTLPVCRMTPEGIDAYLAWEQERGADRNALRRCRRFIQSLYDWLPEPRQITRQALLAWRESLKERGYSGDTERNYVKGVNRYLVFSDRKDLCFPRGNRKDINGQRFGLLTALEPTGEKDRRDRVWRCLCDCGREVSYPATRLLTGNTLSCGCLRREHLQEVNRYFDGTSLRMSMEERVHSTRSGSGYTGVTMKGGKWRAYISYKGRTYTLGTFTGLEDAVKARARGKELVQQDAKGLLNFYEALHSDDPQRPNKSRYLENRERTSPGSELPEEKQRAVRSDNSSGCPGVSRNREKWIARITWQKKTYSLGSYPDLEQAVAARQAAQKLLQEDPQKFVNEYQKEKK